jgi:histidine decarboxylase
MINRRSFLYCAAASSALAACTPNAIRTATGVVQADHFAQDSRLKSRRDLPGKANLLLGYPINMAEPPDTFFQWRKQLADVGIGRLAFNNVGNPYVRSHIPFNTHWMEREVIDRFAERYGFEPSGTWGFLTNSGTDSNMHGMYMGRTILKHRTGILPKVYFTREAHYSIQILRDLLALDWIEVDTHPDGSMDPRSLERLLTMNRSHPAVVVATVGTTFKGAIDPIDGIRSALSSHEAFLHVDAALFGGYLPHTEFADGLIHSRVTNGARAPLSRYDSIAVSCHKFFGFPAPAGLFMTSRKNFDEFHGYFSQVHDPEYVRQIPGTITCSRDAVKPAEFYFYSSESAFSQQREDARAILRNAAYLHDELKMHFSHLRPVRANDRSNTIYFRKPGEALVDRYSLATMSLTYDGKPEPYAHVVVMPHASRGILDRFLQDLEQDSRK